MSILEFGRRLKQVLTPSGSVGERAIKSGVWSGATNTLNRLIQLGKVVILARLLPPADFGLIGIGFIVIAIFRHFSNLGIEEALIQHKKQKVNEYLNTVWVLRVGRGMLIATLAFLLAPLISNVFGEPRATLVIQALGLSPLILGFRNPGIVYFEKDLKFQKRFFQQTSGTLLNFVVAVLLGVMLHNVWALVFGTLAGNVTSLIVSYLIHSYRPQIEFDLAAAKELMDFGKWILGESGIRFLVSQGDDAFLGWFLGATSLGFYQMAYRFANAPATEITQVISSVAFPSYSQVQDETKLLREGFFRTVRVSTFISFPASVGIIMVAPLFVRGLLGAKWTPIVPVMRLLAVGGVLRSIKATMGPLFRAVGRPDLQTKLFGLRFIIMVLLIFPATVRYGLLGASGVVVLTGALIVPISSYLSIDVIEGSIRRFLRILIYPILGSGIMAGGIIGAQEYFTSGIPLIDLITLVLLGIFLYSGYVMIVTWLFGYGIDDELREIYGTFSG